MRAADYYREMENKWQTEYPSVDRLEDVWEYYRECGYRDPEQTIKSLLDQVSWDRRRVLDFGCDNGLMLHFICQLYPQVAGCGIDINGAAIAKAKDMFPGQRFTVFDGLHIPSADQHFDLAFVSAVIKHIRYQDREQVYAELARVAPRVLIIERDATVREEVEQQGWTFYHSHFEEELARHFEPIAVLHEGGDLLGLYDTSGA